MQRDCLGKCLGSVKVSQTSRATCRAQGKDLQYEHCSVFSNKIDYECADLQLVSHLMSTSKSC